jgi:stress response protein YsnF
VSADNRNDDPLKTDDAGRPLVEAAPDDPTLRLLAEEVRVTKETLETGRVRVSTQTHEREALIDEDLARERVEIETIPVGRRIDVVPAVRQEGDTTIVPVVEEVLVVERQLMLKEEIRIKRVRTTERHRETVMLRHQEAVVTRDQGNSGKAESTSVSGAGRAEADKPTAGGREGREPRRL